MIQSIEDIRVGHLLKFFLAVFCSLFVWVMMTTGVGLWWGAVILSKAADGFFQPDGFPQFISDGVRMLLISVPALGFGLIFAADVWTKFYSPKVNETP